MLSLLSSSVKSSALENYVLALVSSSCLYRPFSFGLCPLVSPSRYLSSVDPISAGTCRWRRNFFLCCGCCRNAKCGSWSRLVCDRGVSHFCTQIAWIFSVQPPILPSTDSASFHYSSANVWGPIGHVSLADHMLRLSRSHFGPVCQGYQHQRPFYCEIAFCQGWSPHHLCIVDFSYWKMFWYHHMEAPPWQHSQKIKYWHFSSKFVIDHLSSFAVSGSAAIFGWCFGPHASWKICRIWLASYSVSPYLMIFLSLWVFCHFYIYLPIGFCQPAYSFPLVIFSRFWLDLLFGVGCSQWQLFWPIRSNFAPIPKLPLILWLHLLSIFWFISPFSWQPDFLNFCAWPVGSFLIRGACF